jgi:hypothetical protein
MKPKGVTVRKFAVLFYSLLTVAAFSGGGYALANSSGELANCDQPGNPVYVDCGASTSEVSDPRTGASYTATATANVCRRESTGDECVGTTQTVGRSGAEAGPTHASSDSSVPLPQACLGTTCAGGGTVTALSKVTVFQSGVTPEAQVYAPTGAVNANAPQACVSRDNMCNASSGNTGTGRAAVENPNPSGIVTTGGE